METAARDLPLAHRMSFKTTVFSALVLSSLGGWPAHAARVQVLLFGQPCALEGPAEFSESQLKAIHQISPEQTPLSENLVSLRSSLERLQTAGDLPATFLKYREQRKTRLNAGIKFEEAVAKAHRHGDAGAFAESTQGLLSARRQRGLIKKLQAALKAGPSQRAWDDVREYFFESAGPDGEEDFHRTLRRLKIQYHCTFEGDRNEDEVQADLEGSKASPPAGRKN